MRNPFRRQAETAAPTLRERAAELRASLTRPQQQPEPVATEPEEVVDWHSPPPGFMASPAIEPFSFARIPDGITLELGRLHGIALAEFERRTEGKASGPEAAATRQELRLDVLSMAAGRSGQYPTAGGIAHGDGTVSFTDASGVVSRAPMAHWVGFVAMQMHSLIQGEIGRQRVAANALEPAAYEAWEKEARRDLRSDAVHAFAFRHLRAFEAAQALRSGTEPATQEMRKRDDAELLALAPAWETATDLLQQRTDEQHACEISASADGRPGPAPEGTRPGWQAWRERCDEWRERTGITAAEAAASDASDALYEIEDRIAGLSAASLDGLKFKARVAQRHDDIEVDWPDGLGAGLVRDVLALADAAPAGVQSPDLLTAAGIDPKAMPLQDLISLHSSVNLLSDVADAISCQPKSMTGDRWNAAGSMVNWLGNGLSDATEAVAAEMRTREASGCIERDQRLASLAPAILEGGDPAAALALAREILAAV